MYCGVFGVHPELTCLFESSWCNCRWLSRQRGELKNGILSLEKEAALTVAFGDAWRTSSERKTVSFDEALACFKAYVELHGGKLPTRTAVDEHGFKVGIWMHHRRSDYSYGRLTEDRIAALEAIPGWAWRDVDRNDQLSFVEAMGLVKEFVRENGRLPTARETGPDPEVINLGTWVFMKRRQGREGKLLPEQKAGLEEIPGWKWNPPRGTAAVKEPRARRQ